MKHLILLAALLPAPAFAAELWCMPETICSDETTCVSTTDEELSIRVADMDADTTTLRAHAEDIAMMRHPGDGSVEWMGSNAAGLAEYVVWTEADRAFTYTLTLADGAMRKATGYCEVQ
jgi:hypothetical protein